MYRLDSKNFTTTILTLRKGSWSLIRKVLMRNGLQGRFLLMRRVRNLAICSSTLGSMSKITRITTLVCTLRKFKLVTISVFSLRCLLQHRHRNFQNLFSITRERVILKHHLQGNQDRKLLISIIYWELQRFRVKSIRLLFLQNKTK